MKTTYIIRVRIAENICPYCGSGAFNFLGDGSGAPGEEWEFEGKTCRMDEIACEKCSAQWSQAYEDGKFVGSELGDGTEFCEPGRRKANASYLPESAIEALEKMGRLPRGFLFSGPFPIKRIARRSR